MTTFTEQFDLSAYDEDHIAARAKLNEGMAQATRDFIAALEPLALEEYMFQRFVRGIWDDATAMREVREHLERLAHNIVTTVNYQLTSDVLDYARYLKGGDA